MIRNIGPVDRTIRVVAGIVVLSLVFVGPQTPWGYLGLLPLLTGLSGYCPLYQLAHISTNRPAQRSRPV